MTTSEHRKAVLEADRQAKRIIAWQREGNKRGFFPLPWEEDCWSASILVEHAATQQVQVGNEVLECAGVEWGGMSYVLGETLFAWDRRIRGEYYPYMAPGGHDHEHHFLDVLSRAAREGGAVEPEQVEQYYAPWMVEHLALLRTGGGDLLRRAKAWAKKREGSWETLADLCPELAPPPLLCRVRGEIRSCTTVEQVYALAAQEPETFELVDGERLYSREQRESVEGILEYQQAAQAGLAP